MTSHDVASEAGVSQATVARAYAAPEKVADATRTLVFEAAERLGYVPNAIARSLKAQRTDIIGAVVPAVGEYWQHVLTRLSRQLTARRRQLLLFSFDGAGEVDGLLDSVARYRLDGLIAASANVGETNLARLAQLDLPCVAFNQPDASGVVGSVTVDNEVGMRRLADHVVEQGAQSAMFIGGLPGASTNRKRAHGAIDQLAHHGIACEAVDAGSFSYEAGHKLAPWLADRPLPEALLVGSDEVAFGLIDGLRERGIHAPHDLLITGFDGLPQARWSGYDLTTLEQPIDLLVDQALGWLLEPSPASGEPEGRAGDVVVPGMLRVGRTTDSAAARGADPSTHGSIETMPTATQRAKTEGTTDRA